MGVVHRGSFRLSFLVGDLDQLALSASDILAHVRSRPSWDAASICPAEREFPRVHIEWHDGRGFVVQCFEDESSWGWFLVSASNFGPPTIEINLGGQARERWPSELFVSDEGALRALECFLDSGKQDPTQQWVRIDGFPRDTVWEGREAREVWERQNPPPRRDV